MKSVFRHSHTRSLFTASVLLLAACQVGDSAPTIVQTEQELIGGVFDPDDPSVVALSFGAGFSFCTGALISPSVILTAAHCVDDLGTGPNATIYFGSDLNTEGGRVTVRTKSQHPGWTGNLANGFDIGMLVMDFPAQDPSTALPLNINSPANTHIGEDYRHVGFGVFDRESQRADGRKRTGTTKISGYQGDVILSGDESVSVCFGDSGGPAFLTIDDVEVIAGVHSFTSGQACNPPNGDTDVQLYAESYILPWIQENDPVCRLDGICGPIGCTNDPDCVPCGPDGTCTEGCELPDPDCATQAVGEICRAPSQCAEEGSLCVAYLPDPDYRFCTSSCDLNNDTCAKGLSCQQIIPLGSICYYDDNPPGASGDTCNSAAECGSYQCVDNTCVVSCDISIGVLCTENFSCDQGSDQGYYCFKDPEEGGCSASGGRGGLGSILVLGLAFLLWGRRRQKWS